MKRLAVLLVAALPLTACASTLNAPPPTLVGTWDDSRWGPLAVVDVPNRPAGLTQGTLEVTDRCVFLIEQGERVLLVWPADETEWDAGARSVIFRRLDGQVVTLRSGQRLSVGGGGYVGDEAERPGLERVDETDWVNRPDPECLTDNRWLVSDIEGDE